MKRFIVLEEYGTEYWYHGSPCWVGKFDRGNLADVYSHGYLKAEQAMRRAEKEWRDRDEEKNPQFFVFAVTDKDTMRPLGMIGGRGDDGTILWRMAK